MKNFIFVIFFVHCVLLTRSQVGSALPQSESASSSDTIFARPVEDIEIFRLKFFKNFRYPEKAINAGIRGVYNLEFTVNENSKLTGIKLIPNHGYDIEEAAIRALGRAGAWSPAMVNGVPIKSKQKFEFTLKLQEFRRGVM